MFTSIIEYRLLAQTFGVGLVNNLGMVRWDKDKGTGLSIRKFFFWSCFGT